MHRKIVFHMARKIKFIEPVESISGDLGQRQTLAYALNNNAAYDAPTGKVSTARNYRPTYIAMQSRRSGKNYFALRRKSSVYVDDIARSMWSSMGAANSIAVKALQNLNFAPPLQQMYRYYATLGGRRGLRQWLAEKIKMLLQLREPQLVIVEGTMTVNIGNNPYGDANTAAEISPDVLIKFWDQLGEANIYAYVNETKFCAWGGLSFSAMIETPRLNYLEFTLERMGQVEWVKLGNQYVCTENGQRVASTYTFHGGDYFVLRTNPQNS